MTWEESFACHETVNVTRDQNWFSHVLVDTDWFPFPILDHPMLLPIISHYCVTESNILVIKVLAVVSICIVLTLR